MALKLKSTSVAAHGVIHDRLLSRWSKQGKVYCCGLHIESLDDTILARTTTPRCSFLLQMLSYIVFLILLIWPILVDKDDKSIYFERYIEQQLIVGNGGFSGSGTDFREANSIQAWWTWALNILSVNVFEPPERIAYMELVGSPHVRQFRVISEICPWTTTKLCQPSLDRLRLNWQTGGEHANTTWSDTVGGYVPGTEIIALPRGGYTAYFDSYIQGNWTATLNTLIDNSWIDANTRAVVFDFTVYTSNGRQFGLVTLVTEFSSVGKIISSALISILRQDDLASGFNAIIPSAYAANVILVFCDVGWLVQEFQEMTKNRKYWRDPWNYYEIFIFVGVVAVIILQTLLPGRLDPYQTPDEEIRDWWMIVASLNILRSLLTLLAFLRLLFYVRIIRKTGPLVSAIINMLSDIFNYLFLVAVILLAFAQVFVVLFKDTTGQFNGLRNSFPMLIQGTFGRFSFFTTEGGNTFAYWLGNALLVVYLIISLILLVNLLIAMMTNTYRNVSDAAMEDWGFQFASLVIQYERTYWPPPFNLLLLVFRFVKKLVKREDLCSFCHNKNDDNFVYDSEQSKIAILLVGKDLAKDDVYHLTEVLDGDPPKPQTRSSRRKTTLIQLDNTAMRQMNSSD
eukprot:TRINITY_DN4716_c0_g1_i2.p1 TRINITY_DN4716_c0_g1~~TRINITY_DN4716_c0_g1_i2.p1  ORF type:complete len:702 (+),score=84.75 TRINITY_DN4716_c0_g1_i2:233-2107(+)